MEKKVILITGASSGIGLDGAIELAKMGHIVYGAARRVDRMSKLVEAGGHTIQLDVTNETQIQEGVKRIIEEQGTIDVLWNNAGYGLYGAMEDIPLDIARQQFEVNLFGLARITQEVLPIMREKRSGTIINTSSMGGKIYTPLGSWYHATKHALEGLTKAMALDLAPYRIRVNAIGPTYIETPLTRPLLENQAFRSLVEERLPLSTPEQPIGRVGDLDGALVFLSDSSLSDLITGTNVLVDGGWTAQ